MNMSNLRYGQPVSFDTRTSITDRISSLIITEFEEDSLTVIDSVREDFLEYFLNNYADRNSSVEGETDVEDDSATEYDSESIGSSSEASNYGSEFTHAHRERPPTRGDRTTLTDLYRNTNDIPTLPNFDPSEDIESYSSIYWNPHLPTLANQGRLYDSPLSDEDMCQWRRYCRYRLQ